MIHIISNGCGKSYGIKQYIVDVANDIDNLPKNVYAGCTAFCIENSKTYMINSAGKWKEVIHTCGSGGSSSGSSDDDESYHIIYDGGEEI